MHSRPPRFRTFGILALASALLVPQWACEKEVPESPDVIVLHTGRLRGNIYPLEFSPNISIQHYPYIASFVRAVREEAALIGAEVLLVDLGDSLGGSFASHATDSGNVIEFFNALGYDAILLGNLDGSISPAQLGKIHAPVLSPFTAPDGGPAIPGTSPAVSLSTKSGLAVLLFANFHGDTNPAEFPDRFPQSFGEVEGEVGVVRDYAPLAERFSAGGAPALALFAWQKFEAPEKLPEGFLASLRECGVDAILAHRVYGRGERDVWSEQTFPGWVPPVSQNILRNNGGFTVARADLKRLPGGGWKMLSAKLVPMTANTAPADPAIVGLVNRFAPAIHSSDKEIATLESTVEEPRILDAYLSCLADVPHVAAVAASLQSIRSDWPPGVLRASRVFNSLPWVEPVTRMELDEEQLLTLRSANPAIEFWIREVPDETGAETAPVAPAGVEPDGTLPAETGHELPLPAEELPVVLVTPRYFAKIFARQLGLADGQLSDVAPSEFSLFLEYLLKNGGLPKEVPPPGWKAMPAENVQP